MENRDEPINPVPFSDGAANHLGLTKREYFAGLAMQGLLANASFGFGAETTPESQIAECSWRYADELLKQLDQ